MSRYLAIFFLVIMSAECSAITISLHGFDFANCTRWEFNTDVAHTEDLEYKAAAAKALGLREGKMELEVDDWQVYQAINHSTYDKPILGICRYVHTSSYRPARFECQSSRSFPLSGGSFTVVKDRGLFSSSYRCTTHCPGTVLLIHDSTSEDKGNFELGGSLRKFNKQCQSRSLKK